MNLIQATEIVLNQKYIELEEITGDIQMLKQEFEDGDKSKLGLITNLSDYSRKLEATIDVLNMDIDVEAVMRLGVK